MAFGGLLLTCCFIFHTQNLSRQVLAVKTATATDAYFRTSPTKILIYYSFIPPQLCSSQPFITVLSAAHSAKQLRRLLLTLHLPLTYFLQSLTQQLSICCLSLWFLHAFLWLPFQPPYFLNFLLNQYTWFSLPSLPVCTTLLKSSLCSLVDVCACVLCSYWVNEGIQSYDAFVSKNRFPSDSNYRL